MPIEFGALDQTHHSRRPLARAQRARELAQHAKAAAHAIDGLRTAPEPAPKITDDVSLWLSARSANALYAQDIKTLAQLTVRVPRRRR